MNKNNNSFSNIDFATLQVERAISEIKLGMPIIIESFSNYQIASPEMIDVDLYNNLFANRHSLLILTSERANFLDIISGESIYVALPVDEFSLDEIYQLAAIKECSEILKFKLPDPVELIESQALTAISLAKKAQIMPAMLINFNINYNIPYLSIKSEYIQKYSCFENYYLRKIISTNLTLKNNVSANISLFRPKFGGQEHYSITIGDISKIKTPKVRLHSSCFTGDILGSLSCDCQDQLHETINFMSSSPENAGIILYLIQDGRGIGLANKLRADNLQEQGCDTVEANLILGFADDERVFFGAAQMLRQLGIQDVILLTNNPKKALDLKNLGINVVATENMKMFVNEHNNKYLETKIKKMDHYSN